MRCGFINDQWRNDLARVGDKRCGIFLGVLEIGVLEIGVRVIQLVSPIPSPFASAVLRELVA